MITLTVYRQPEGKRENQEFTLLQDAIEFGQKTGSDYEIFDPRSGKVIDWNEINVRDEDDWYYDENEFLWKKCRADDGFFNGYEPEDHSYPLLNLPFGNQALSGDKLLHSQMSARR